MAKQLTSEKALLCNIIEMTKENIDSEPASWWSDTMSDVDSEIHCHFWTRLQDRIWVEGWDLDNVVVALNNDLDSLNK